MLWLCSIKKEWFFFLNYGFWSEQVSNAKDVRRKIATKHPNHCVVFSCIAVFSAKCCYSETLLEHHYSRQWGSKEIKRNWLLNFFLSQWGYFPQVSSEIVKKKRKERNTHTQTQIKLTLDPVWVFWVWPWLSCCPKTPDGFLMCRNLQNMVTLIFFVYLLVFRVQILRNEGKHMLK